MTTRNYSRLLPSSAASAAEGLKKGGSTSTAARERLSGVARCGPGTLVTLHVYSVTRLSAIQRANGVLGSFGTGAYHAGVEVYGREWSFGATEDGSSGVFCCGPADCDDHAYIRAIPMAETRATEAEVLGLIGRLRTEWSGDDYDLLRCNCCHFSDELLRRLGVGPAPGWLTSLAGAGAVVDDKVAAAASGAAAAKAAGHVAASKLGGALSGGNSSTGFGNFGGFGISSGKCAADTWKAAARAALGKATDSAKGAVAPCRGPDLGRTLSGEMTHGRCH